tara:strand:+ start:57 stop:368 length:312 start_codon:yes stop_codon:yes gene_type:complete
VEKIKMQVITHAQEIGYDPLGTLDYAFQNEDFEKFEKIKLDESSLVNITEETKFNIGECYTLPGVMPSGDKYIFQIECIKDITDIDDHKPDYLWETTIFKREK